MKPQIFFSHAHQDSDFANALRNWIDDALLGAVEFFVSSDKTSIPLGSEWANRIRDALANSAIVLVLVSPSSMSRPWLYFEAGAGYIREIPVVPVCIAGMEPRGLEPPFSFFEAIQLPGKEAELRLLELVATSAGLRPPKLLAELVLPGRVDTFSSTNNGQLKEINIDASLQNLTKSKARILLGRADQKQVQLVQQLMREYFFVMDLHHWPHNNDKPQEVLDEIKSRLKNPVLISKDVAERFIEHAEKTFASCSSPKKSKGFDSSKFDCVIAMIQPFLSELPSQGDYEIALFQHPPNIYVPLLLIETSDDKFTAYYWHALRTLANSEYGSLVLPELAQMLSLIRNTGWELSQIVQLTQLILGDGFDSWYEKVRGRTYQEDLDFLQQEWNKRWAKSDQDKSNESEP